MRKLKAVGVDPAMKINFWGVHGSLPVSGPDFTKYGGSTSCVSLELASGELIAFDAGSGVRRFGNALISGKLPQKEMALLFSHPHWDHINAISFFMPLYSKQYRCHFFGPGTPEVGIKDMISAQMSGVFFPITIRECKAEMSFTNLGEEVFNYGPAQISTQLLNHPGACLGYRVAYQGLSFAYITDLEIMDQSNPQFKVEQYRKLVSFINGVDVLVIDSTYTNDEYLQRQGWGHSSVGQVVNLAHEAQVKKLCLFHHDPDQNDKQIDLKLEWAQSRLKQLNSSTICVAPTEGSTIALNLAQSRKKTSKAG